VARRDLRGSAGPADPEGTKVIAAHGDLRGSAVPEVPMDPRGIKEMKVAKGNKDSPD
jgi:hypothetical protein